MAMSLWAAGGALVLAVIAFMAYDFISYRTTLVSSLSTLGEIISLNASSSVVFNVTLLNEKGSHIYQGTGQTGAHLRPLVLYRHHAAQVA